MARIYTSFDNSVYSFYDVAEFMECPDSGLDESSVWSHDELDDEELFHYYETVEGQSFYTLAPHAK